MKSKPFIFNYTVLPLNYQGPVQKFFDCMYEKVTPSVMMERDEVKAMRLWSDWNAGLRSWAASKVEEVILILHASYFTSLISVAV